MSYPSRSLTTRSVLALACLAAMPAFAQPTQYDGLGPVVEHLLAIDGPSETTRPLFDALARRGALQALTEVKVTASVDQDELFGIAVAARGETALVSAPTFLGVSAVYVFNRSGSRWVEAQRLTPPDDPLLFGIGVDIDGDRAVFTALNKDALLDENGNVLISAGSRGGLYVFRRAADGHWAFEQKISARHDLGFGVDVEIDGTTIVAGSPLEEAAYVYELESGGWVESQRLTASDGAVGDGFGTTIELVDDTLVVGASSFVTGSGAAYVFERDAGGYEQTQKLTASDSSTGTYAALDIAVDGDTMAIGDDTNRTVYLYRQVQGTWLETQRIVADDPEASSDFGFSVELEGRTLVIGARFEAGGGASYVYTKQAGQWQQSLRVGASDGEQDDAFGTSLALDGSTLVVGALGDDGGRGGAYVYNLRIPGVPSLLGASLGNPDFGGLGGCQGQGAGIDGLPVVFDRPVAPLSVQATDFRIVTATGERVQPLCVSFIPSINLDEGQTILTQADYGPRGQTPLAVEIVGSIKSFDRSVDYQGQSVSVAPFEVGGILVYARQLPVRLLGQFQRCPVGTGQVIQLGFGSNAGNNTFQTDTDTLGRFEVTLQDGTIANPFAFADVLVDNYLELCLVETSPATVVEIAPDTIMNAGGLMNPETLRGIVAP